MAAFIADSVLDNMAKPVGLSHREPKMAKFTARVSVYTPYTLEMTYKTGSPVTTREFRDFWWLQASQCFVIHLDHRENHHETGSGALLYFKWESYCMVQKQADNFQLE